MARQKLTPSEIVDRLESIQNLYNAHQYDVSLQDIHQVKGMLWIFWMGDSDKLVQTLFDLSLSGYLIESIHHEMKSRTPFITVYLCRESDKAAATTNIDASVIETLGRMLCAETGKQ